MRDRWAAAAFAFGLGAFCAVGFVFGHHLPGVGVALGLVAAVLSVAVTGAALRHRGLVRGLRRCSAPTELSGIPVRMGTLGDAVFVAGLGRPTIYCDRRLPQQLTEAELRAVLLHERAHQRALDPARLLALGLVAPFARRFASGRQWVAVALARREIAADRYALAQGARRGEIAGALLKLRPLARAHVAGFTPAVDLRLRALLGDVEQVRSSLLLRSSATFVGGGLVGAALCTWLLHHWVESSFGLVCC
jgi:hypothetical protein